MPTWTKEELTYLKNNFELGDKSNIIHHLGRSWSTIRHKASEFELSRKGKTPQRLLIKLEGVISAKPWLSYDQVANELGVCRHTIMNKLYLLNTNFTSVKTRVVKEEFLRLQEVEINFYKVKDEDNLND